MRRSFSFFSLLALALAFSASGCGSSYDSNMGNKLPQINAEPESTAVTVGKTATFSVSATGSAALTYQWQKNMANISGANSASYTTPATVNADNGATFDVIVSDPSGSTTSTTATLTVNPAPTLQSIAVTPPSPTINVGSAQQFKATGTYSDNSMQDITASATWASSDARFATIGVSTGLATGTGVGTTQISAKLGTVASPNDPLMVTAAVAGAFDVVTHHYDTMRSGANTQETTLTTSNVNSTTFGKVAEFTIDGEVDGQILYLNQVAIPGQGNKNVLYFSTENDSVYALDADSMSGSSATILWKSSAMPTGEVAVTPSDAGCGYINPVGIVSTPVIDRSRNAIYVVSASKSNGNVHHWIYAFNLTNGNSLFGGPQQIAATFPGTGGNSSNGTVTFKDSVQQQRAALLESNGTIYTVWSGYDGDCGDYSAWAIAFSADTLAQVGAIDLVPHSDLAGIWLGGGGPAADSSGNVYFATGNAGSGNTPGIGNDYGDTFVKLGAGTPLAVADYFAPSIAIQDDRDDEDLGSSAPLLLPDMVDGGGVTRHLAVVAGKDGAIYVASRDNMGEYNAMADNIYQELASDGHENFSSPVYFNGSVYIGPSGLPLRAFGVTQAKLSTSPTSQTSASFGSNGVVVSVSANGTTNGIVWALDHDSGQLFACDATNLANLLYNSSQAAGGRDQFSGVGGHFITPMVVNGKVYFGTGSTVVVFGLL
jgi:Bacterial Ig-like domain (group 2)